MAASNNLTPGPNAEMEAESSLIFLTHPKVISQLKQWVGFDLEEIQLAKTRVPVWTKEQGFNKDNIARDKYILIFGGDIREEDFNPNIISAKWEASIAKVKRPGPVKGSATAAPTKTLYRESNAAQIPEGVDVGNTYVPSAKAYDAVSGSKKVGDVKAVKARNSGGQKRGAAYAQTLKGPRVYVEETPENAVESATTDLNKQIVTELVNSVKAIDQKLYELRKRGGSQEEIRAWLQKRQQVNEVLAVYSN